MTDYAYAGASTAIPPDGSRTIIAINIIPDEVSSVEASGSMND